MLQFFHEYYSGIKGNIECDSQKGPRLIYSHYGQGKLSYAQRVTTPLSCFQALVILQWNPPMSVSSGRSRGSSPPAITGFKGLSVSNYCIGEPGYQCSFPRSSWRLVEFHGKLSNRLLLQSNVDAPLRVLVKTSATCVFTYSDTASNVFSWEKHYTWTGTFWGPYTVPGTVLDTSNFWQTCFHAYN